MTAGERRVYLREPTLADADVLAASALRSRELHHPWATPPTTPAGWRQQLERMDERRKSRLGCLRADDAVVGMVNLSDIVHGALRNASMGYEAFSPYDGQGLMRETLSLVIDWAFSELRLHRLEANIQPGNTRSAALVERLGFRKEGFSPRYLFLTGAWRDHDRWAITAEEWPRSEES